MINEIKCRRVVINFGQMEMNIQGILKVFVGGTYIDIAYFDEVGGDFIDGLFFSNDRIKNWTYELLDE